MSTITVKPMRILMVEDDDADVLLAKRAFSRARIWNTMELVRNGKEAMDYLTNQGAFADTALFPRPDVVLLDLNLPVIDGREVLEKIRRNPALKDLPVVIVSTSDFDKDIEFGRVRGVRHYIIKPLAVDNVIEIFAALPGWNLIAGAVQA